MARNARINVGVSPSSKERLVRMSETYDISQGDIVEDALKNFFEKQDRHHSAPDLVLDRLNALTLSIMELTRAVASLQDGMRQMQEQMEQEE